MRILKSLGTAALLAVAVLSASRTKAQTAPNLAPLRGLALVSALANTFAGKAALTSNLAITAAIQNGSAHHLQMKIDLSGDT